MDVRFLQAWFNSEHVVLGRRLHPFCLYDALILSAEGSPFISDTEGEVSYGMEDLEVAAVVCSTDPERFLNARFMTSWRERIQAFYLGVKARRALRRSPEFLTVTGDAFNAYLADYNSAPKFWTDGEAAGKIRCPWLLANAVFLLRNTTFRPAEVWRLPIGQVFWYSAALAEQMGTSASEVMTIEEEEAMDEMSKLSPEAEAEILARHKGIQRE